MGLLGDSEGALYILGAVFLLIVIVVPLFICVLSNIRQTRRELERRLERNEVLLAELSEKLSAMAVLLPEEIEADEKKRQ
ncbi:MAG: hypothetical protein Q4C56_02220 [Peptococcaceae bacterium]|nr:hypothetical protein [Peptococcaceae bacterium]